MRKLVIGPALLGALLVAGTAGAQEHPWVPSGYNGAVGSLPNGAPAAAVPDHHPWVSSNVYTGNLPNGAPAYAAGRTAVPAATAQAGKRHTAETR